MEKPIIETGVASTIRGAARQIADGAGLGLLRGPAGVGKSFALDLVAAELEADGVEIVRVTASPVIGGSVAAFTRAVLAPYRVEVSSTQDAFEAIWGLLRARAGVGPPVPSPAEGWPVFLLPAGPSAGINDPEGMTHERRLHRPCPRRA